MLRYKKLFKELSQEAFQRTFQKTFQVSSGFKYRSTLYNSNLEKIEILDDLFQLYSLSTDNANIHEKMKSIITLYQLKTS